MDPNRASTHIVNFIGNFAHHGTAIQAASGGNYLFVAYQESNNLEAMHAIVFRARIVDGSPVLETETFSGKPGEVDAAARSWWEQR